MGSVVSKMGSVEIIYLYRTIVSSRLSGPFFSLSPLAVYRAMPGKLTMPQRHA